MRQIIRAGVLRMRKSLTLAAELGSMTLFHFANCLALTVAPYFILYRFSGL